MLKARAIWIHTMTVAGGNRTEAPVPRSSELYRVAAVVRKPLDLEDGGGEGFLWDHNALRVRPPDTGGDRMAMKVGLAKAHLRVARPTDDLAAVVRFYCDGLGLEVLFEFQDHNGFDGVMLGWRGIPHHLEFTRRAGHKAGRAPTEDNLLVFYLPDKEEWKSAVARMEATGYGAVKAFNPYWEMNGKTFEDPDGYRVVLQNASWPAV